MMNKSLYARLFCFCLLSSVLLACQPIKEITPTITLTALAAAPTSTLTPTVTSLPNRSTPLTPIEEMELPDFPTRTPVPTSTFTPAPTPTRPQPLPGSVLPSPIIYQVGGQINAVAAAGNLAYVGVGPRLYILDVTDPANPQVVGVSGMLPGVIEDLVVGDGVVYAAAGTLGIYVMDVHNPTLPQPITTIPVVYERHQLYLYENLLLVIDQNRIQDVKDERLSQLIVVDVTDPASPVQQDVLALPDWSSGLAWYQSYLYVAIHSYYYGSEPGLWIMNASALPEIEPITFLTDIDDPVAIATYKGQLILSTGHGIITYDLSDPLLPAEIRNYGALYPVNDNLLAIENALLASGNFCDLGECGSSIGVYPLEQPDGEREIRDTNIGFLTYDMEVEGNVIFAAAGTELVILSTSPIFTPYRLSSWNSTGLVGLLSLDAQNLYAFNDNEDSFIVFYVGDTKQPTFIRSYDTHYTLTDFIVSGETAYLSADSNGLVTVQTDDFSQLASLLMTPYGTPAIADITLAPNLIFALLRGNLVAVDMTNPVSPLLLSPVDWQERADGQWTSLVWYEPYLYVGVNGSRLSLFDVIDPTQPIEIGTIELANTICQNTVQNSMVFVIAGTCSRYVEPKSSQLLLVDVSNPTNPQITGLLTLIGVMNDVEVIGNYAYVANGDVLVVDVSDPSQPVLITTITTPGYASDLLTADGLLYVADQAGGLLVIQPFE